ncbi:MAG TPA: hypothetical protein DEF02_03380 [Clostridiales bacterium]|nr:hypothetical protein [Clostridiales bacterium]
MKQEKTVLLKAEICMLILCLICLMISLCFEPIKSYDIAFAESNQTRAVGDSKIVVATAHPDGVPQTFEWTLTWDKDKTSSITYAVIKDKDPYDYLSLEIDGGECKITVLKYHKVGITYTVYLTLTATSKDNPDCSATCSIKLG